MVALALIIHTILILAMVIAVICFESDCKKIIFWNLIITLTSIFGFVVYFIYFCDKPKIKKTIKSKFEQDAIYKNLINFSTGKVNSNNEFINFNKRHYLAEIFKNNSIEVIDNIEMFVNSVSNELEKAKKYIVLESEVFLSGIRNDNIVSLLKEKQSMGVEVKYVYGHCKQADKTIIKELRESGVRVCRFNKNDTFNAYYKNTKNLICIDGKQVYLYNLVSNKPSPAISHSNLFYKVKGEVVKSIDLDCHLDVSFATQKFYELEQQEYLPCGEVEMQYVSSVADKDFEGLFLKAINDAKKRIIIHINKFIPTPALKQALQMAIMSGIDVKIMLPKNRASNYYSSRAYAKEMAMYGATGYFYDGVIDSNFIVIDNLSFVGDFSLVNLEIRNNLQNVLIINSAEFSEKAKNYFNEQVNNSYRICKPKNILFKEKVFKKFN